MTGKRQTLWCRESVLESSDGLHLWIDTRNSRDVHRATRFCHRWCSHHKAVGQVSAAGGWLGAN